MRFSIRDLLWLTAVMACLVWGGMCRYDFLREREVRRQQGRELERANTAVVYWRAFAGYYEDLHRAYSRLWVVAYPDE